MLAFMGYYHRVPRMDRKDGQKRESAAQHRLLPPWVCRALSIMLRSQSIVQTQYTGVRESC